MAHRHAASPGRDATVGTVVTDHRSAVHLYEDDGWARAGTVTWMLPDGSPLTELVYVSPSPAPTGPPA
ncbi:MAG: hypothetical protein ACYCV5_13415 [Acidimicrobiales bacterium]